MRYKIWPGKPADNRLCEINGFATDPMISFLKIRALHLSVSTSQSPSSFHFESLLIAQQTVTSVKQA